MSEKQKEMNQFRLYLFISKVLLDYLLLLVSFIHSFIHYYLSSTCWMDLDFGENEKNQKKEEFIINNRYCVISKIFRIIKHIKNILLKICIILYL